MEREAVIYWCSRCR